MSELAGLPRLMLVTDRRRARGRDLVGQVVKAARGGVGMVQLREKDLPERELEDLALRIKTEAPSGTLLAINGSVRVALNLGVALHLPADGVTPGIGGLLLHGRSAHDEREARIAVTDGSSYVVLGPIFPTLSKPGHPGAGVELIRQIRPFVEPLPIYAIGGITVSHVPEVIHAGAHGVAVCGALVSASDPRRVAEALALALDVAGAR